MEVLRTALLPRRITQIYTDTKKFYEQIVQEQVTNPQVSSLHLKLRIQKDRLNAWGIEWAENNAQQGDIDDSLDRAGISDLVASIMTSIKELLDDAEKVQPSYRPPGSLPDQKGGFISKPNRQWTTEDLARLEDLVKSITTSIDTLCDLSRSTQTIRDISSSDKKKKKLSKRSSESSKANSRSSTPVPYSPTNNSFPLSGVSNVVTSARIDPRQLRFPHRPTTPGAAPPDYDDVTSDPDSRKFALLRPAPSRIPTAGSFAETPVLVDFGYAFDHTATWENEIPSLKRYESLILALQAPDRDHDDNYTGCLRILGWFIDESRSRFGFIYEIPRPDPLSNLRPHPVTPLTLLSFLQHSGNTDSENTPSLEDRYRLALNLVTNLLHTHAKGVTHRHINSNNVIFIQNGPRSEESKPWKEGIIRKPYLVSWDQCDDDAANPADDTHVPRLYRHPASALGKRSSFKPAFDVYSLGLVLLEIGLWLPLHKLFKTKYTLPKFRYKLQSTYAHKLAGKCGSAYMKVVEYCLHAADMETSPAAQRLSQNFERAKRQENFYWNALKPLERCCMIDESSQPTVHPFPSMAGKAGALETSAELASSASTAAPAKQPEERLEADSPVEQGLTYDVLVWSYEIPSHVRTYYKTVMLPKLNKMLARAIDRWEGYTIMTFMAGESPQTAKPTIFISCLSVTRAWKILEYVNRERNYFDIKVSVGQTCYSKASKKRGRRPKRLNLTRARQVTDLSEPFNPGKYHRKPSCGASISAFVDEQHLERATFGGIILADGEPFGMSVHHMLEDTDVDQGLNFVLEPEAADEPTNNMPGSMPEDVQSDTSSSAQKWERTEYPQDDDFDPSILDQDFGDEDEELFTMGDTVGTAPGEGRDKVVTQPALDDVDPTFFPSEEDKSDEHLQSHSLGYIHASSGRKQVRHGEQNVAHEVDWALFKVCDGRLHATNKVNGGDRYCKFEPSESSGNYPSQLLAAETLGNREVHAIGATSGLANGTILPEMVEQKMPGRVFSSTVWRFRGKFGVGGDSGAWIVDNASGALCGHVTAWNERGAYGILAPMEVMFHDMEHTLGKTVALPTAHSSSCQSYVEQVISPATNIVPAAAEKADPTESYEDEAVDLHSGGSGASSPELPRARPIIPTDCDTTIRQQIGQQFTNESTESTCPSTADNDGSDYELVQPDSANTSSTSLPFEASPPSSPSNSTMKSMGEDGGDKATKLDGVAERWSGETAFRGKDCRKEERATSGEGRGKGVKAEC